MAGCFLASEAEDLPPKPDPAMSPAIIQPLVFFPAGAGCAGRASAGHHRSRCKSGASSVVEQADSHGEKRSVFECAQAGRRTRAARADCGAPQVRVAS